MRDLHWHLDSLPPHLRVQVERQLAPMPARIAAAEAIKSVATTVPTRKAGMFHARRHADLTDTLAGFAETKTEDLKTNVSVKPREVDRKRKTLTPDMAPSLVKSCEVSPDGKEVRLVLGIDCYMLPTAQQKGAFVGKDGRVHFFTKSKVAKSEKALVKALSVYAIHFAEWGNAPISLSIDYCFPFTKSASKKELIDYSYHTTRPDVDNLTKSVLDSMTQSNFWTDDSLISELHLRKFRVLSDPRIVLTIRKLNNTLVDFLTDLFGTKSKPYFGDWTKEQPSSGQAQNA